MKRLLRVIVIFALLALIAVGVTQAFQARREMRQAQSSAEVLDEFIVGADTLRVTVSATGSILPDEQMLLTFEAPGLVSAVFVREGESVAQGAALARLDTTDFETALANVEAALDLQRIAYQALTAPPREVDLAVAQAALDAASAGVNAAASTGVTSQQREIARLQAELARNQLWQAQLQRDLAALPQDPISFAPDVTGFIPDDVEVPPEIIDQINEGLSGLFPPISLPSGPSAETFSSGLTQAEFGVQIADANAAATANRGADSGAIASANAAVIAAQVALDRLSGGADDEDRRLAEIGLLQAGLAVEQARLALDRAVLTAPFAGEVAQLNLRVGEPPPTNEPAVLLVDQSGYYVDLAIDETDVVRVSEGQAVEFRIDALPDAAITGRVARIAPAPTVIGQLVTYFVRAEIDPTDAPIRIGMSATATIVVNELTEVLTLPNRFIRIDRTTREAFVTIEREPGRFVEVPVVLGVRNETTSEIVSGLEVGQRVVLLPRDAFDIFDGPPQ
jgi:HlyD family secretion protein